LTQTIFYGVYRISHGNAQPPRGLRFFMVGLGLCLAFVAAWGAHIGLDSLIGWWTEPLAPHLHIIK
jgi:hypothetical protein